MSRKKDIDSMAPLKALLYSISEQEARRQLERLSARQLRERRKRIDWAMHPMRDPEFRKLKAEWDEINKVAGKMLAEWRAKCARTFPDHSTVQ